MWDFKTAPNFFSLTPLKKKKKPKKKTKKSENIMFMVILSALVKRLNVPHMRDFYFIPADLCHIPKKNYILSSLTRYLSVPIYMTVRLVDPLVNTNIRRSSKRTILCPL